MSDKNKQPKGQSKKRYYEQYRALNKKVMHKERRIKRHIKRQEAKIRKFKKQGRVTDGLTKDIVLANEAIERLYKNTA